MAKLLARNRKLQARGRRLVNSACPGNCCGGPTGPPPGPPGLDCCDWWGYDSADPCLWGVPPNNSPAFRATPGSRQHCFECGTHYLLEGSVTASETGFTHATFIDACNACLGECAFSSAPTSTPLAIQTQYTWEFAGETRHRRLDNGDCNTECRCIVNRDHFSDSLYDGGFRFFTAGCQGWRPVGTGASSRQYGTDFCQGNNDWDDTCSLGGAFSCNPSFNPPAVILNRFATNVCAPPFVSDVSDTAGEQCGPFGTPCNFPRRRETRYSSDVDWTPNPFGWTKRITGTYLQRETFNGTTTFELRREYQADLRLTRLETCTPSPCPAGFVGDSGGPGGPPDPFIPRGFLYAENKALTPDSLARIRRWNEDRQARGFPEHMRPVMVEPRDIRGALDVL